MSTPIEPDEIIPPGAPGAAQKAAGKADPNKHAAAKIVATWLDDLLHLPGTKFKIGLDPFLSLIPGVGDFLSSSISTVVILESVRKGVAPSVITRMGLNMLINAAFDALPGVGSVLSAFFKSNSRNLALLHRWQESPEAARQIRRSSRWVMVVALGGILLSMLLSVLSWVVGVWILVKLFSL